MTVLVDALEYEQRELERLFDRLQKKTDANKYRTGSSKAYEAPDARGYDTLDVLHFLWNKPLSDLTMAYVHSLRPTSIRIHDGCTTCDGRTGRVSIWVDAHDIVQQISQEIEIAYGSGVEIRECWRAMCELRRPHASSGSCLGNMAGLARADFQ